MKRRSFLMMLGLAPIAQAAASETISEGRIISCKIAEETICAPKICTYAITAGPEWYRKLAENPVRSDRISGNAMPRQQA